MLMVKILLASILSASGVLADGAAIVDAISGIQNATTELTTTVASWDGGILGALPIVSESTSLLTAINDATDTAKQSANLTDLEAVTVGLSIVSLVTGVNSSLTTIIDAKPKFDKVLLSGVVLINLALEKSASADFSNAVLEKLPTSFVSVGETLSGEITDSFDQAIDVYNGPF
ncbi:hypothetical protein N0V93_005402 [Gnomoniopsis smithogilvyi]|uniref:Uncharacterized protein n=1 Tax=Gnomoniopsis smithogilvyi TaxID=1191159 RepID=A0A9W8YWI6_9PEZI|nr:hypothetical protein N0V93_005402 [Gnomoniopsis smithogilvyi]